VGNAVTIAWVIFLTKTLNYLMISVFVNVMNAHLVKQICLQKNNILGLTNKDLHAIIVEIVDRSDYEKHN
jgi:hypothetical protein